MVLTINIVELFGGIGSPRIALERILGDEIESIDYVEIDKYAVNSYNAIFSEKYQPCSIVDWKFNKEIHSKPDILIHGSPCQDISIIGKQKGADKESQTKSSLMWETIRCIEQMNDFKPKVIVWENVENVLSKNMTRNFNKYISIMESMGYKSSYKVMDSRDFGLPQMRKRVFTVSVLDEKAFDFSNVKGTEMKDIKYFLLNNDDVEPIYDVTQPFLLECIQRIGYKSIRRASIIKDYAYTITCRQDRCPAQIIDCGNGRYRYLTELECWLLQGFSKEEFELAKNAQIKKGRWYTQLYKQAGNAISIPVLENLFKAIINQHFS